MPDDLVLTQELRKRIHETEFALLNFGHTFPQFRVMAEDIANLIVGLHAAYERLDREVRQRHV